MLFCVFCFYVQFIGLWHAIKKEVGRGVKWVLLTSFWAVVWQASESCSLSLSIVGGSLVMTSSASKGQPFFMWLVAVAKNSLRSRHVTRSMVVILSDTATLLALVKPAVTKNMTCNTGLLPQQTSALSTTTDQTKHRSHSQHKFQNNHGWLSKQQQLLFTNICINTLYT